MASRHHLEAATIAIWQSHDPHDHGARWHPSLHPHHLQRQTKQVTKPQERPPTGVRRDALLFNIYISKLPSIASRKHAFVGDLAITHADADWEAVDRLLSKNMANVGEYFQTWKLKLSTTKTVSAAFPLNKKKVTSELKINHNNEILPFYSEPKYFWLTCD